MERPRVARPLRGGQVEQYFARYLWRPSETRAAAVQLAGLSAQTVLVQSRYLHQLDHVRCQL